jgi:hypothetical protein
MPEARSRSIPREDNARRHHPGADRTPTRRSDHGRRETSGSPVTARGQRPRADSTIREDRRSRERARCGYTFSIRVADIGITHLGGSRPCARKTHGPREPPSPEEIRQPRPTRGAGRETAKGCASRFMTEPAWRVRARSIAPGAKARCQAFSGSRPPCPHRRGDAESSVSR